MHLPIQYLPQALKLTRDAIAAVKDGHPTVEQIEAVKLVTEGKITPEQIDEAVVDFQHAAIQLAQARQAPPTPPPAVERDVVKP